MVKSTYTAHHITGSAHHHLIITHIRQIIQIDSADSLIAVLPFVRTAVIVDDTSMFQTYTDESIDE
jgi:hypothetical protein